MVLGALSCFGVLLRICYSCDDEITRQSNAQGVFDIYAISVYMKFEPFFSFVHPVAIVERTHQISVLDDRISIKPKRIIDISYIMAFVHMMIQFVHHKLDVHSYIFSSLYNIEVIILIGDD